MQVNSYAASPVTDNRREKKAKQRTLGDDHKVNIKSLEMSIPKHQNDLSTDGSLGNHALIE